jgi:hypothetical protein
MTAYHPFALRGSKGPMGGAVPAAEEEAALSFFRSLGFENAMIDGQGA